MPEPNQPAPDRHDPARAPAPRAAAAPAPAPTAAPEPKDKADSTALLADAIKALAERTPAPGGIAAAPDMDVTQPGGRFNVGNKLVNAHGRELNEDGSLKHPEQQQVDAFGRLV